MGRLFVVASRRMSWLWIAMVISFVFASLASTTHSFPLSDGTSRYGFVGLCRCMNDASTLSYRSHVQKTNFELGLLYKNINSYRWTLLNEQSSSDISTESDNRNVDSEDVTPESNAWETMQRWKEEILLDSLLSSKFDKKVPKLFTESKVETLQDINDKEADTNWLSSLTTCGVNTFVFSEKLNTVVFVKGGTRMVSVNYEIAESTLSHTADLDALYKRVDESFEWYQPRTPPKTPPEFVAPYFPFIQSSGMGKTKLLYELSERLSKEKDTECHLCLSGPINIDRDDWRPKTDKMVFSCTMDFQSAIRGAKTSGKGKSTMAQAQIAAESVMKTLDNFFLLSAEKRLVLLFDEAQVLLGDDFGIDAFLFQCVRLWLRIKDTKRKFQCVAVFAGTTSNLANFFPDESLVTTFSSRDVDKEDNVREFLPSGRQLPLPFFQTTTIGCCLTNNVTINSVAAAASPIEYDKAVPFGRPLFVKMAENNQLETRLGKVLTRMLLSDVNEWWKNDASCLSILGTRVQMGQTSTDIASRLVSKGYANLVGFYDSKVAQICYFPDPVCARLAMALMDEDWKIRLKGSDVVCGRSKWWWVERAAATFSSGLCRPDKGNAGEVFAALYLLFCGDLLRKEVGSEDFESLEASLLPTNPSEESRRLDVSPSVQIPSYRHFSIPLGRWVAKLMRPTPNSAELVADSSNTSSSEEAVQPASGPSVCFIQVFRNYLRPYRDYKYVTSQSLLEYLYNSGTAFYTFPVCPHFDIVAPIRYKHEGHFRFAPLLISVKACNRLEFSEANSICHDMESGLIATETCHRGLCIVMAMGAAVGSKYKRRTLKEGDVEKLFAAGTENRVIAKVLRIDNDDAFGISQSMIEATSDGQEVSELLESHHCVRAHANDSSDLPLTFVNSMRKRKEKGAEIREGVVFLNTLIEQLVGMPSADA